MKRVLHRSTPAHSEEKAFVNAKSVKELHRLLEDVAKDPRTAPQELVAAWNHQGTLAKLNLLSEGIVPMSLNTLKSHAEVVVAGGWKALNGSRERAKAVYEKHLERETLPSRGSRKDLQRRLDAANDDAQRHVNIVAEFAEMYSDLFSIARNAAEGDRNLQSALERHRRRYQRHNSDLRIVGREYES